MKGSNIRRSSSRWLITRIIQFPKHEKNAKKNAAVSSYMNKQTHKLSQNERPVRLKRHHIRRLRRIHISNMSILNEKRQVELSENKKKNKPLVNGLLLKSSPSTSGMKRVNRTR